MKPGSVSVPSRILLHGPTDRIKAAETIKAARPRLSSVRSPSSQPWKIVSTYNLHDEPIYQSLGYEPVPGSEDLELQDTEYHGGGPDMMDKVDYGKAPSVRRPSVIERISGGSVKDLPKQRLRRKSTAGTIIPDYIVTWEGPDDPENPKNWTLGRKWAATVIVSLFTFMAPVASSMIAPCLSTMSNELNVHGEFDMTLLLSIFILAFAVGPLLFGPLSEIYGRVRLLQATNLFYLVWNLACGFAKTKNQMLAFRFLSGLGGSAPAAIGGGVLGDCWRPEQRGKAVAAYSLAPLIGPAVGPIIGGFIAENISWRWVFWVSCIGDAIIQLFGLFFLQETYAPELLHRKAKRLRKQTGNKQLHTEFEQANSTLPAKLTQSMVRPFRLILTQPLVQVLSIYMAYLYGLTFIVYATFPTLWIDRYHESMDISGLNYISLSIGYAFGTQIIAPLNDRVYHALKKRNGGVGKPEFRCPTMLPGSILVVIGLFWYGWSAQAKLHWIMPDIGMVFFSMGVDIGFQCSTTYLIDCYTHFAASAIAAAVVLRSFAGFGLPLVAPTMYQRLGYGWGNSILAFVAIVLGLPAPFLLWKFGPVLRNRSKYAAGD